MAKCITLDQANEIYQKKYANGKRGKPISLCDDLYKDYQDFCFNRLNRTPISERVRLLMIKDMADTGWFDN